MNPENELTNGDVHDFPVYRENGFEYRALPEFGIENVKLFGYFQSYKYFEDFFGRICETIQLRTQQESIREEFRHLFSSEKYSISMHFRLGDYKEKQEYHPIMPYEYYENALQHALHKRGLQNQYQVIYFCEEEDNQHVVEVVAKLRIKTPNVDFVKVDDRIADWKQMLIMSCCDDNIIANSSFSWWGAYFNGRADKHVFYPHVWFGSALQHNIGDLFPASWSKILF